MKRYLIIDYWRNEPEKMVQTDSLEKEHLIEAKGSSMHLIDTENKTYYDAEKNEWIKITIK